MQPRVAAQLEHRLLRMFLMPVIVGKVLRSVAVHVPGMNSKPAVPDRERRPYGAGLTTSQPGGPKSGSPAGTSGKGDKLNQLKNKFLGTRSASGTGTSANSSSSSAAGPGQASPLLGGRKKKGHVKTGRHGLSEAFKGLADSIGGSDSGGYGGGGFGGGDGGGGGGGE